MKRIVILAMVAALFLAPAIATAACEVEGSGEVNVISNSFPVLELIANTMKACANDNLKIEYKLTTEHKEETAQALAASSSPYDLVQVSNTTIPAWQAAGQLQPMNDLVDKYRDQYKLEDSMLIRIGGDIMAVAFQVNAQHLFYRTDLLEKHGIAVPKTYDEVLAAAEKLKSEESIEFPLGGTYKSGWNLAQEFINMFMGMGGEFFKPGTAEPSLNSEAGVKALEMMKKLMAYMSPNALALDTTAIMQQFQQGKIAMATLWASRAAKMDDEAESKVVGLIEFTAAPSASKGAHPATTLWWDGFSLAKNMDGDRDLAFQMIMLGLSEEVVKANNDVAIWLRSAYKPTRFSKGVAESAMGGAPSYPMQPQISMVHAAIGNNIGDFLAGKESAEESLADVEAEYTKAAKEKGFIK